jgi:NAD(P)-dependent dehydrogenase (short-subunit alcohol dehydrogenase family)
MLKSIFITGASAGIGKATSLLFANMGWFVGAVDVNASGLEKLKNKAKNKIGFSSPLDVTNAEKVSLAIKEFAAATGGRMDVLFNNAGILRTGPFESISLKDHHAILDTNIRGMINCTYQAFPLLKNTRGSRVINMASVASIIGVPTEATYAASKFWVRGFTEALHVEWKRYGVYVCDIMPCFVNTPMVEQNSGTFINSVGIHITAEKVAATVWKAVQKKRLHWLIDRPHRRFYYKIRSFVPYQVEKYVLRKMAGL